MIQKNENGLMNMQTDGISFQSTLSEVPWFLLTAGSTLLHTQDMLPPSNSTYDEFLNIAVTMFPLCVNICRSFLRCAEKGGEKAEMGRNEDRVDL